MGIDIYARWRGQTKAERDVQVTGFSAVHGHVGYLREAYHGEPYATRFLVAEAFAAEDGRAQVPAAVLRKRLPRTLELVRERERTLYEGSEEESQEVEQSYIAFVALCERKEWETGEPVTVIASY